jgi:hypothetical protein
MRVMQVTDRRDVREIDFRNKVEGAPSDAHYSSEA